MSIFWPTFGKSIVTRPSPPAPTMFLDRTFAPLGMTHVVADRESHLDAGAGRFVNRDFAPAPPAGRGSGTLSALQKFRARYLFEEARFRIGEGVAVQRAARRVA